MLRDVEGRRGEPLGRDLHRDSAHRRRRGGRVRDAPPVREVAAAGDDGDEDEDPEEGHDR